MTKNFNYFLPPRLIAQKPAQPANSARLMVLDRHRQKISQAYFYDLAKFLPHRAVFVFNKTRVQPVRLFGYKPSGGKVEIFILHLSPHLTAWLHPGLKPGQTVIIPTNSQKNNVIVRVNHHQEKEFTLEVVKGNLDLQFLHQYGHTPLPPYIHSSEKESLLRRWYQPVFAKEGFSVASPTASLHFTPHFLEELKKKGFSFAFVRLDVGRGTFEPVRREKIKEHQMHSELFTLSKRTAQLLNQAKKKKQPIIAVGTTVARTLESSYSYKDGFIPQKRATTDLFIYPPYQFRSFDILITNFHLPRSTLLMLVSAFVSWPNTPTPFTIFSQSLLGKAYQLAIQEKYRFYSFGDAMLIL